MFNLPRGLKQLEGCICGSVLDGACIAFRKYRRIRFEVPTSLTRIGFSCLEVPQEMHGLFAVMDAAEAAHSKSAELEKP